MGLGLVKELGLGFGLWVSNMDRESEKGLGANERLVEGNMGLRVSAGLAGKLGLRVFAGLEGICWVGCQRSLPQKPWTS